MPIEACTAKTFSKRCRPVDWVVESDAGDADRGSAARDRARARVPALHLETRRRRRCTCRLSHPSSAPRASGRPPELQLVLGGDLLHLGRRTPSVAAGPRAATAGDDAGLQGSTSSVPMQHLLPSAGRYLSGRADWWVQRPRPGRVLRLLLPAVRPVRLCEDRGRCRSSCRAR